MTDRKAMMRAYKENPPPMGVWAVHNTVDDRWLVGASPNAKGRLNRERFTLDHGSHPSRDLQADWNRLGEEAFTFEVLDTIPEPDDPEVRAADELTALLELWLEKLALPEDRLYPHRG